MPDTPVHDALHDCLELLASGGTLAECAARYPTMADELAPLLAVAVQAQGAAAGVTPSPEAQRAGLGRVADAWAQKQSRRGRRGVPWRVMGRSWALAAIAALALIFGGWTTSSAASDSVPGDVLYPVKETQERVLLLVVFTDRGKADLYARLAQKRTREVEKLTHSGGDPAALDRSAERLEEHTRRAVALMGGKLPPPHDDDGAPRRRGAPRYGEVHESVFIRVRGTADSRHRFLMQERFFHQFLEHQQLRRGLPPELLPTHRQRMEAALMRSEEILREAIMAMQALEQAQSTSR